MMQEAKKQSRWGWALPTMRLVGLSLLPIILTLLLVVQLFYEESEQSVERQIEGVVQGAQVSLDGKLQYGLRLAVALAESRSLKAGNLSDFASEARSIVTQDADLAWIVVTDHVTREFIFHSGRPGTPAKAEPAGPNALYQGNEVLESGKPRIFGLRRHGPTIQTRTIPIRAPILEASRERLSMTVMLEAKALNKLFDSMPPSWTAMVVDPDGTIAAAKGTAAGPVGTSVTRAQAQRLAQDVCPADTNTPLNVRSTHLNEHLLTLFEQSDRYLEVASCSSETNWSVLVQVPAKEVHAPFREGLRLILGVGTLSILFSVLIALHLGKRLEDTKELRAAKNAAEAANELKSEFLANMSHELRTPLNAILGHAQLMAAEQNDGQSQSIGKSSVRNKQHVDEINRAGWHLLELIEDVLDLSKIESGNLELVQSSTELLPLLNQCESQLAPRAEKAGVTLLPSIVQADAQWVFCDPLRLRQVVLNLLSNGIKYNQPGGTVQINAIAIDANLVGISVQDTGRGMSQAQIQQLFQPFVRFVERDEVIEGTGIGLALSKRLVEMMGGTLTVKSQPSAGSNFTVQLARGTAPASDTSRPESLVEKVIAPKNPVAVTDPSSAQEPVCVLYVEDTQTNFEIVRIFLERQQSFRLVHAPDGETALKLVQKDRPDIILLDMNLPGMSGLEVKKQLALDLVTADIPVIALSANAMQSDIEQALGAGFHHYLTKPILLPRLLETLNALTQESSQTE